MDVTVSRLAYFRATLYLLSNGLSASNFSALVLPIDLVSAVVIG
jgi:hypothetical protein